MYSSDATSAGSGKQRVQVKAPGPSGSRARCTSERAAQDALLASRRLAEALAAQYLALP